MNQKHLLLLTCFPLLLSAQKREEGFNALFKPTKDSPRYYVITEPKNGKWYREAYFLPEKSMAMQGWYQDEECNIADSIVTWYHPNGKLKSTGFYKNGKKEGVWVDYHVNGMMRDSMYYEDGFLKGNSLGWNLDGYQTDSSYFDGKGKGVQVHWYSNGPVYSTGHFVNDTTRAGHWNYYHKNGRKMADVEYVNGKRDVIACFSETGEKLDDCEEKESFFPGEEKGWRKFLEKNLDAAVPVRNRAPVGKYTVIIQVIVDPEGHITELTPLTNFGFGMEQEVIRIMKKSPPWTPTHQFGKNLNSYKRQSITFVVGSR